MQFMMACASHSPFFYHPGKLSEGVIAVREAVAAQRARVQAFSPDLVILFGGDHYGGHQMASMPAFCVGVEATALNDVGGFPGQLSVPRDIAVGAVDFLRQQDIDVAVSYAMEVDHGFSLPLETLTGAIDTYSVLPIFVCCLQPPFVPFHRARLLGEAVGRYAKTLSRERILFIGTGGLSHNPEMLFPSIDDVSDQWRPYVLHGVEQETWIRYEKDAHQYASGLLADDGATAEQFGILKDWDEAFLEHFCGEDLMVFDSWSPKAITKSAGIGAMETLSWIAAAAAMRSATGRRPHTVFHNPCRELGVGFGIAEAAPARAL